MRKLVQITLIALFIVCGCMALADGLAWHHYSNSHQCKVMGTKPMVDGQSQTGWRCDDGALYWR